MNPVPKCFVAYPSALPGRGDAIEAAVENFNKGSLVEAISWKSLTVSGRPIISAICDQIRQADILIADITNLNPNVLFELGYAIANRRRLWLIFNPKVSGAKVLFDRFQLLTTTGYSAYSNSHEIATKFYSEQPYSPSHPIFYDEITRSTSTPVKQDSLLYIKPDESTEAVTRIARRVSASPIPPVIDDPKEIGIQPIEWYVSNVKAARGVICHFLSDDYEDVRISNAKAAFVAGLAYALGKPLLMLAHSPYVSPIDYRDLLKTHQDAKQAEQFYQTWLAELLDEQKDKDKRRTIHTTVVEAHGGLLQLTIGDPIAEYESDELPEYFIPTSAYAEALTGKHSIFVGRKGTGKTATLLKVVDELRADPRNHICIIKPVDYELDGLLSLLQRQMTTSEKGFLIESFWKALTYTELAKSVFERILERPEFAERSAAEKALIEFVESNGDLILPEFSARLENLVARIADFSNEAPEAELKNRISEAVHRVILGRLRNLLLDALEKTTKVAVLVDNLDKNWTTRTNLQLVSELLFGLLSVSVRVSDEFKKSSLGKRKLNVTMTIFIRSDIYAAIVSFAREPDKLPIRRIEWSDPELLVRVIEKRLMNADARLLDPKEAWTKYFTAEVHDIPTKELLISSVFPRPRDLIYLVRASLQNAVNRGHQIIEENDVESGLEQYSGFVLASLMAEGTPQFRHLDDFMTQLFGGTTILTEDDVREALEGANLGIVNSEFIIDLLQDLTFLSYETSPDNFVFAFEKDLKPKLSSMSKKTARLVGTKRYKVHPAFHAYLELKPASVEGQFPLSFKPLPKQA